MSVFTNKHVVMASVIAPVLALIAYFSVNAMLGEEPKAAEAGQSYKLIAKSNCRRNSGTCGLKNNDFELTLSFEWLDTERMLLKLTSVYPLDGVLVALVKNKTDETPPAEMQSAGEDGLNWSLELDHPDPENDRLHLVATAAGALYFADTAMKFALPKTENF